MLGRKGMKAYVSKILPGAGKVKIKRVVKLEDLLPLLQFEAADAIFVSSTAAEVIKAKSQADLRSYIVQGAKSQLPALSFFGNQKDAGLASAVKSMGQTANQAVGVESWR